jgi:F0F1-type ATP synthase delta subunit
MNSTDEIRLAKRYARAWNSFFAEPMDEHSIDAINQAITYLKQHPQVRFMLQLSIIDEDTKYDALHWLDISYALPTGYAQLCALLIKHKRSFILESVLKAIVDMYWEHKNVEWFTITSASSLSFDQKQSCQLFLAAACHKQIRCKYVVSSHLIAGIRMQSSHFLWEHSINKQLCMIYQRLV